VELVGRIQRDAVARGSIDRRKGQAAIARWFGNGMVAEFGSPYFGLTMRPRWTKWWSVARRESAEVSERGANKIVQVTEGSLRSWKKK